MLTPKDLKGVIAIPATPAKPDAGDWRARDTVDTVELARAVDQLIKDGAGALFLGGTSGECGYLLDEEVLTVAATVAEAAKKRVPTFVGATRLGTRATIDLQRKVIDRGIDGSLLGCPMWQAPTIETAVEHYSDVAEAVPNCAIVVYQNNEAFDFNFPPGFWRALSAKTSHVIGGKDGNAGSLLAKLRATGGKVNFIPNDSAAYSFAMLSPETTTCLWSVACCSGPEVVVALWKAIERRDMAKAKEISEEFGDANRSWQPGDPHVFNQYNAQLVHIRIDASNYMKAGPCRPPNNTPVPESIAVGAREAGRKIMELRKKYAQVAVK